MTDFEWFLAAAAICLFALLYAAAMGDDDGPDVPESGMDL